MISGLLNASLAPKTNYFYLCRYQYTSNNARNSQRIFDRYYLWGFQNVGNPTFGKIEKTGAENPVDPSNKFLKISDTGPISF